MIEDATRKKRWWSDAMVAWRGNYDQSWVPPVTDPLYLKGYPQLTEGHPLFELQQAGWVSHTPEEAWRLVAERTKPARTDSKTHPAYAADYIVNDTQAKEAADAKAQSEERPGEGGAQAARR